LGETAVFICSSRINMLEIIKREIIFHAHTLRVILEGCIDMIKWVIFRKVVNVIQ